MILAMTAKCKKCSKEYIIYFDKGEDHDKPCPHCNNGNNKT